MVPPGRTWPLLASCGPQRGAAASLTQACARLSSLLAWPGQPPPRTATPTDEGGGKPGAGLALSRPVTGTGRRTPEKRGEPGGWRRWPPSPPCTTYHHPSAYRVDPPPPPGRPAPAALRGFRSRGPPKRGGPPSSTWSAPRPPPPELPGARRRAAAPGSRAALERCSLPPSTRSGPEGPWRVQRPAGRHAGSLPLMPTGSSCMAHQPPLITRSNCTSAGCSSIRSPSH